MAVIIKLPSEFEYLELDFVLLYQNVVAIVYLKFIHAFIAP